MKPQVGKRITLPISDKDKRISSRKTYLLKHDGRWYVGKWQMQWYGWNFDGVFPAGCQYNYPDIQAVYELDLG